MKPSPHFNVAWFQHEFAQVTIDYYINGCGETNDFNFRSCKNGNLHLEFKRMDLVKS